MLRQLYISNFLLIAELNVEFKEGFNVITGETGAGKSIVVGALQLLFGRRSNTKVIRAGCKKCIIEGVFKIDTKNLETFFDEYDLDFDQECIIRREIRDTGKSRVFINDTPVTLAVLNKLSTILVDFHQQQDQSLLKNSGYYIHIIDHLSNNLDNLAAYQQLFKQYLSDQKKLEELEKTFSDKEINLEFNQFQLHELKELEIVDEDQDINNRLTKAENAEGILSSLSSALSELEQNDFSVLSVLRDVRQKLASSSNYDSRLNEQVQRIDNSFEELQETATEIEQYLQNLSIDEEELRALRDRSDHINRLLSKHRLKEVKDLINLEEELNDRISQIDTNREQIDVLRKQLKETEITLTQKAEELSKRRTKGIEVFELQIQRSLISLGMKNNRVEIQRTPSKDLHINGSDEMEVLFSANKGVEPQPLHLIASGGERSRIMLSIKSLVAQHLSLPILIFDEIDTGISGDVALKVGQTIQSLSKFYQIICISHLPQVVAQGSNHILVYKEEEKESTFTKVKSLSPQERITELAVMLSGNDPSEAAISNAKGLLRISKN